MESIKLINGKSVALIFVTVLCLEYIETGFGISTQINCSELLFLWKVLNYSLKWK